MNHLNFVLCLVGLVLASAAPARAVVIKTSDGDGADTELREGAGITRGGAKDLNTRWSISPSNTEIIALRFDLTGIDRAFITNARLETTVNRTGMPANTGFDVFGLWGGASGQDWTEGTSNGLWNAANPFPGLIYDNVYTWLPNVDDNQIHSLGQVSWNTPPGLGDTLTFDSSNAYYQNFDLSGFLRHAGDLATIFLQAAQGSNTQLRLASKETVTLGQTGTGQPFGTGQYAPRLVFDIGQATRIYQWEYVEPNNPSLGKQQSGTLCPEGSFLEQAVFTAPFRNLTKAYLHAADLHGANLESANLTEAYLHAADLHGAFLVSANLTDADLSQANLTNTTLDHATLSGANLSQANLTNATLLYATLSGANLSQANLTGVNANNATMTNADLSHADLTNANFLYASLTNASFSGAIVRGTQLHATEFTQEQLYSTASYQAHDLTGIILQMNNLGWNFAGQNLTGASVSSVTLTNANFSQANLTNANLGGNLTNANFSQAYLTGANLTNANLTGANFSQANLTNAYLVQAVLTDANFSGAEVRGASFQNNNTPNFALTLAQLYSTASYQAGDLTGISLGGNNLSGANFAGMNLTGASLGGIINANFSDANLTGAHFGGDVANANFTGALVQGAHFGGVNLTTTQLYSTASYQAGDLTGINLGGDLTGWNFAAQNLTSARLSYATLTDADLSQANLTNAYFLRAILTGANMTGAEVRGANFAHDDTWGGGISPAQLASTASYQARDLTGIVFENNNLTGADLSGQNLTNANFEAANLTGANLSQTILRNTNFTRVNLSSTNLTGADVRGARFDRVDVNTYEDRCIAWTSGGFVCSAWEQVVVATFTGGINLAQLETTASYQSGDLSGIHLTNTNLAGADFAGFNLTNANFSGDTLTGADLSRADARGTTGLNLTGAIATNLIRPDGHVYGFDLSAGQSFIIRDYDGNTDTSSAPIAITVDQHFAMGPGGMLQMVFEADAWDSTISFAAGIPVTLGGTLELLFADGIDLASQVGRTFDLFNWAGVAPTGAFNIASPYIWNLSNLYTTGEVTLAAVPEPTTLALVAAGVLGLVGCAPRRRDRKLKNHFPCFQILCSNKTNGSMRNTNHH